MALTIAVLIIVALKTTAKTLLQVKKAFETDGMVGFGNDKASDKNFNSNGGSQDWNDNSTSAEWNHNEIAKPANEDDSWGNGSNSMSLDATFSESTTMVPRIQVKPPFQQRK